MLCHESEVKYVLRLCCQPEQMRRGDTDTQQHNPLLRVNRVTGRAEEERFGRAGAPQLSPAAADLPPGTVLSQLCVPRVAFFPSPTPKAKPVRVCGLHSSRDNTSTETRTKGCRTAV